MTKLTTRLGDRLLAALAPRVTGAALAAGCRYVEGCRPGCGRICCTSTGCGLCYC